MIAIRRADQRGQGRFGWLEARYSFSFAGYHDPEHTGLRSLRVMNEDRIEPSGAFPMHPHEDMEILTHVLEGTLEHRDSMGNGSLIQSGEFQLMSAGSGVTHSEANASGTDPLHLMQIWILPSEPGLVPSYEQRSFADRGNTLRLVAAPDGEGGALTIHQDARLFSALLDAGRSLTHELEPGRHAWVQVLRGRLSLNDQKLETGDGASTSGGASLVLRADDDAEFLLFDLA